MLFQTLLACLWITITDSYFFHLGVAATPLITLLLRQERDLHLIMSTILGWIRLYF